MVVVAVVDEVDGEGGSGGGGGDDGEGGAVAAVVGEGHGRGDSGVLVNRGAGWRRLGSGAGGGRGGGGVSSEGEAEGAAADQVPLHDAGRRHARGVAYRPTRETRGISSCSVASS
eukprot:6876612-Alexandrium_andersonii.AAC.1